MIVNESRSERRIYQLSVRRGLYDANYRPINPKTGKPWQAWRSIPGRDCYRLFNYGTGAETGIILGKLPPFEVWTKVDGGMNSATTGFSSEVVAQAAIDAAKARE
jgi:hypothetical protein